MTKHYKLIEGLQCGINATHCNYRTGKVTLYLPEGHCTSMTGAIALATSYFPEVRTIETIAGDEPDTIYRRILGDQWEAFMPKEETP